jgi:protein O-GlcNAc transferase
MLERLFLNNIHNLFNKKKFDEIILKINTNNHFLLNYPDLYNIRAVSKIFKLNNNKTDIISALKDFENYFFYSKDNGKKIEGVCNFIATCVVNSKKYDDIIPYFKDAEYLFEKCQNDIGYNEKLFISGVDLYKYLLNLNKAKKLLKELIKNKTRSKVVYCALGYLNNYDYEWDQKKYFEYSKKSDIFFSKYKVKKINEINYSLNKKIKIGFISKDFTSNHSITWMIKNVLINLNKNNFESYGISLTDDKFLNGSSLELKNNFNKWLNFSKFTNIEIISKLQDQKIEILVDLMGLFHPDRIEIFNSRVAPIQISWVGYPNTVGFSNIDYLISDKNLIKNNEDKYYSEKIIKMSNIWNCHSGFQIKRQFIDAPYKKNKYFTFGSFNNFLKISDEVIEVWGKILKKVNNSILILKSSLNVNKDIILKKFENYGVENSIRFCKKQEELEDHLKYYKEIDIALDTFPYNGVVTTFESLWSGVPVIGMRGFHMNSRCGESILKNGNLEFLISKNKIDYIEKVLLYTKNPDKLDNLRLNIYKNILNTPLFDAKKFTKDFENKLLEVYIKSK